MKDIGIPFKILLKSMDFLSNQWISFQNPSNPFLNQWIYFKKLMVSFSRCIKCLAKINGFPFKILSKSFKNRCQILSISNGLPFGASRFQRFQKISFGAATSHRFRIVFISKGIVLISKRNLMEIYTIL